MKLRNKKTGEIVELVDIFCKYGRLFYRLEDKRGIFKREITSLAELKDEWEDYKEPPKEYWYVNSDSLIYATDCDKYPDSDLLRKEIGNYFETREDAEKAVEKLKAWKRLKDVRFEFGTIKYNLDEKSSSTIAYDGIITIKGMAYEDFVYDLDLLFGGEE